MRPFSISATPLDCRTLAAQMRHAASGAFVAFEGWVRNHNEGKAVEKLEYEVFHALALSEGEAVLREAMQRFAVTGLCAVHREGRLQIGDCAVWVGATSAHRAEAFAACSYAIDALKHRLPIWKKEYYVGGAAEWVNCHHHAHHQASA